MTIKEKMLKIIALAMSIKATDSYYLSIDWNNNTNHVNINVHKHINGKSQGVVESYTYDGVINYDSYVSYDVMMDWLNRMKREWEEI
jgi:hypothetical protein